MKRIVLSILMVLVFCNLVFAIDFTGWKVAIKQVEKRHNKVAIVLDIITPGLKHYGREISLYYDEIKDLTLSEFREKIKEQARYIIEQEYDDYLFKNKVNSIINIEVSVE